MMDSGFETIKSLLTLCDIMESRELKWVADSGNVHRETLGLDAIVLFIRHADAWPLDSRLRGNDE
jgi:hypothetical protein